jgi:hypothetical protein
MKKWIKKLASLKLAVVVILSIVVITAVGTIVEAKYNAAVASTWVYRSFWMYLIMMLLSVNLMAVMFDRWPWKLKHIGFISAHIGILILLSGALITQKYGVDGSIRFAIGEKKSQVVVSETELTLWKSTDGVKYFPIMNHEIDVLKNPPHESPIDFPTDENGIQVAINDDIPFAEPHERVLESKEDHAGAGLRFQISNQNVNVTDWLVQSTDRSDSDYNLGPAVIHLSRELPKASTGKNEIFFQPLNNPNNSLKYVVLNKDPAKKNFVGEVKEGDLIETGWMGLKVKVLRYFPKALRTYEFKRLAHPNAMTTSAVFVKFKDNSQGKESVKESVKESWIQLNDVARFQTDKAIYVIRFSNKQIDIGEELYLKDFKIGRYQGTRRAMAYQSLVEDPSGVEHLISMNEPLKFKGYTFYQASFEEDPKSGNPSASVLSVNKDPGRLLKYLGSLLVCFGIVHLFWFKGRLFKGEKNV